MYQQYLNQALASVSGLSSDDLKELLNDDDKLEERVNTVLATLESDKQQILDQNARLAEKNLTREPELAEQRNHINDLSTQGKELCSQVQDLLTESKSKSSTINQDTAHALLQTAAAESEEQSEAIVKQLMDKELSVEQFLDKFLTIRKTMHLRKVQADKMDEITRQMRQSAALGTNNAAASRPYSGYYPGSPAQPTSGAVPAPYPMSGGTAAQVPYPRGPIMNMPMPGQYSPYPRP